MSLNTLLIPIALFLVIGNSPVGSAPANPRPGKLKLTILESDSGQPTPARVELQDSKGQGYVAEDAAWYEILNTGFRITPTAGTDYPCVGASIPGRERFYTKVEGQLVTN